MAAKISDLAQILRQTRKLAGLSQMELAELAGVGKTLIFNLEKGHENVSLDNLLKVLGVLNIGLEIVPPPLARSQSTKGRKKE